MTEPIQNMCANYMKIGTPSNTQEGISYLSFTSVPNNKQTH